MFKNVCQEIFLTVEKKSSCQIGRDAFSEGRSEFFAALTAPIGRFYAPIRRIFSRQQQAILL